MERAGRLLGGALRRLRRPEAGIAWLASAWPEIVGENLAAHTRPVRCESGYLEITADAQEWATHLRGMQREFCAHINCEWGGDLVRDIAFVSPQRATEAAGATASRRLPRELDNHHTPFLRRRPV
jgi:predicted nucleic acid-binding Zn ribbon protein